MGAECEGQDPETESMELGYCVVYLEGAYRSSVLLQSSTGVYYDFLPRRLVKKCSLESVSHKLSHDTRAYCKSEGAGFV